MKKTSRHMVRGDDKTQTSISLRADLLKRAQKAAKDDGRSFSNLIEQMLKEKFPEATQLPKSGSNAEKGKPLDG